MRNLELSELTRVNGGSYGLPFAAVTATLFGSAFLMAPRILQSYGFKYTAPVDGKTGMIISDFDQLMSTFSSAQQQTIHAYIGHVTESAQAQGLINGLQHF